MRLRTPHNEVQKRYGKSRWTLRRWVRSGKFPAPVETPGGELEWFTDELDAYDATLPRVNYAPEETISLAREKAPPPRSGIRRFSGPPIHLSSE